MIKVHRGSKAIGEHLGFCARSPTALPDETAKQDAERIFQWCITQLPVRTVQELQKLFCGRGVLRAPVANKFVDPRSSGDPSPFVAFEEVSIDSNTKSD